MVNDTTVQLNNPFWYHFRYHKVILVDKTKTLNDKIKANKAQYSLDRKAANISALSSGKFNKYEYLTGEELIPKSRSIEKTCFEYFQVSQIFIKWLEEEEKEEDKKTWTFKKVKRYWV